MRWKYVASPGWRIIKTDGDHPSVWWLSPEKKPFIGGDVWLRPVLDHPVIPPMRFSSMFSVGTS